MARLFGVTTMKCHNKELAQARQEADTDPIYYRRNGAWSMLGRYSIRRNDMEVLYRYGTHLHNLLTDDETEFERPGRVRVTREEVLEMIKGHPIELELRKYDVPHKNGLGQGESGRLARHGNE